MGIVDEFMELKEETDADLLAMQVGDFYEFFGEDARSVNDDLGLKLSEKSSHGSSYPMAGVPIEDLEQYVNQLVERKGYTVAVADQYEENGQHKREIVRKVTPGTMLESIEEESRYLCAVLVDDDSVGLAFTDVSSGQILLEESTSDEILNDISVYRPVEILIATTGVDPQPIIDVEDEISNYLNTRIHQHSTSVNEDELQNRVSEHFGEEIMSSLNLQSDNVSVSAAGIILDYLKESIPKVRDSVTQLQHIGDDDYVRMDARTRKSLELIETISSETGQSLLSVMDKTVTSNGKDKLTRYIQRPLKSEDKIRRRQKSVSDLVKTATKREEIVQVLETFPNLPRIASRATYGSARPREISKIIDGLEAVDRLKNVFIESPMLASSPLSEQLRELDQQRIDNLRMMIDNALVDDPPNKVDKGLIAEGYDDELDEIIREHEQNKEWFDDLEEQVKSTYDLTHVTVDRNKTDGYYIQVGRSEADQMPRQKYDEIKKLKNSKRFKNDELRDRERTFMRLKEKREEKESEVFEDLLETVSQDADLLQDVGDSIAHLDAMLSLARHAVENRWVRPEVENSRGVSIKGGRHPVVEQNVEFVPNDTNIHEGRDFLIVTGPNMAGKSTYLRQTSLIVLLSQIGSYIPAESAQIGIVDAIYTRVGAMDEISKGRSTFMVEMAELANILHSSTDNSLVILDEVGRGTATYDGISIAQSTIEYLAADRGLQTPLTLFATHYHELTSIADDYDNIQNVHVAVKSGDNREDYEFIRKVRDGPADKSYGIRVADIAGVPDPVISRSEELLEELRDVEES